MSCKPDFIVSLYNLIMIIFCFSCMLVKNLFIYYFIKKQVFIGKENSFMLFNFFSSSKFYLSGAYLLDMSQLFRCVSHLFRYVFGFFKFLYI